MSGASTTFATITDSRNPHDTEPDTPEKTDLTTDTFRPLRHLPGYIALQGELYSFISGYI